MRRKGFGAERRTSRGERGKTENRRVGKKDDSFVHPLSWKACTNGKAPLLEVSCCWVLLEACCRIILFFLNCGTVD